MSAKVGVVLSGSGVFDGSEIHEATLTLLYLDQAGAEVKCFAPDVDQREVVDHATSESQASEKRNCLKESARIARGEIKALSEMNVADFDAVILPGGFGAAKNLCSFAVDGPGCEINTEVEKAIQDAVAQGKVVGAICIAPAVVARALKDSGKNPVLTIGTDAGTADGLRALNATHQDAQVSEIVVDEANRIVTTPAYMLGQRISEVAEGIEALVKRVVSMAG